MAIIKMTSWLTLTIHPATQPSCAHAYIKSIHRCRVDCQLIVVIHLFIPLKIKYILSACLW